MRWVLEKLVGAVHQIASEVAPCGLALTGLPAGGTIPPPPFRRACALGAPMFGIGVPELMIILAICVLLFGARRLPEIGSGIGKAIRNFKSGVSGKDEIDVTPDEESEKVTDGESRS